MSILFFGDSLTEGSNSSTRYTDFLPPEWNVVNAAVSGTTIGEYSIYPVDGNSLLGLIGKYTQEIRNAELIFIEYGSNDISAIMCGFATVQTVIVSFVKAVDWIKQINPKAKIIFLTFGGDEVIRDRARRMSKYLEEEYFKSFNFKFPVSLYYDAYTKLMDNIGKVCDTMYMLPEELIEDEYISDDGIHPNEKGHELIAKKLLAQLTR